MAGTIQVRAENDPYVTMEEKEMLVKLKRSREHFEEGRYREADAVVSNLRRKYGFERIVTEDAKADMDRFAEETLILKRTSLKRRDGDLSRIYVRYSVFFYCEIERMRQ